MVRTWLTVSMTLAFVNLVACGKGQSNTAPGDLDMGHEDMFVSLDWGETGPGFDVGMVVAQLPVEVLGPPGTEATIEIALSGVQADSTVDLRLRLANVVLPNSAEVVLNGAYTIPLTEPGSEFVRPTGGWAEAVVSLDPRQVRNGVNYLVFRWSGDSPEIAGYRVVGAAVEIDGTAFGVDTWDDPTAWTPADPSDDAVERGRRYFQNVSRGGNRVCAECHTTSGADLQYYAYSDTSIVAYAGLMGFQEAEGRDIANYIRSLDVGRDGRPWVGPFQPGPDNYGAAGGGMDAVVTDADVRRAWFGDTPPTQIEWDHPAGFDPFHVALSLQVPTWNRWLPRRVDLAWFDMLNGRLDQALGAYQDDEGIDAAHGLLAAAVEVGRELERDGDHEARIDLLRWAAVKLWDWSRTQSFYEPHHGLPDAPWANNTQVGSPAYMAEVGFAQFDASGAGNPTALGAAAQWWTAQMAADSGRGRSTGLRPLNYHAYLTALQGLVGPNEIAWIYVLGSWEESRGTLIDLWGAAEGPVRLLPAALPFAPDDLLPMLWRRFVTREAEHAIGGGTFTDEHLALLQRAWVATCMRLDDNTREQLIATTPDALRNELACE